MSKSLAVVKLSPSIAGSSLWEAAMEEGIHCTLSTLMGKQRVSIQDVHSATGLSRNTISSLYHDRATRIDYATLGKLCTFFNCGVSDLLDYTPDE